MACVLIVEDNPFMQTVAKKMLEKLGYESAIAASGAEALAMATADEYPIILLDCHIPIISGYEVATELRSREKNGTKNYVSRIIACTANSMKGDKEKCLAAGMDDYINKPLSEETLKQALNKNLSQSA